MKNLIPVIGLLLLANILYAQQMIKNFVHQSQARIASINPDSTDFDDLKIIGQSIGDAKIVMLGEQDHGDAPTFLAKTRLIKYLHEKLGFNVLAFESDFFGLNFGFDKLEKNGSSVIAFMKKNIFPIWTGCNTCADLFYHYIPDTYQTQNPLTVTGFDNQMILAYSAHNLTFYLDSLFQTLALPAIANSKYRGEILPALDTLRFAYSMPAYEFDKVESFLEQIKSEAIARLPPNNFGIQVINSLIAECREYKLIRSNRVASMDARDSQMAENLKWLSAVKFPNEKIIVWAANAHVAKYVDSSKNGKLQTMGTYLVRDSNLLKKIYVLGFDSYSGQAGRLGMQTYAVRKPKADGFENWIDKSVEYAFVDFKSFHLKNPGVSEEFYIKALGHNTAFKKDWSQVFDGIFFIRNMYPCKR